MAAGDSGHTPGNERGMSKDEPALRLDGRGTSEATAKTAKTANLMPVFRLMAAPDM